MLYSEVNTSDNPFLFIWIKDHKLFYLDYFLHKDVNTVQNTGGGGELTENAINNKKLNVK